MYSPTKLLKPLILLLYCLLSCICGTAYSQDRPLLPVSDSILERELARAEACLISFENDSAIAITGNLLNTLNARGQVDTPFGIRVQLAEANAFEQDQRTELALGKMLRIQQLSQENRLWGIHAKSCLVLALIYEKIELGDRSREQLDQAQIDIDRYGLGAVYPYFAIRRASWERFYGDGDAALFYAREALRTAPDYGLILEEAISHMLMNMLLPKSALTERLQHCLTAVKLYQKLGDHTGSGSMLHAVTQIHIQQKNFRQALAFSDSTLATNRRAIAEGNEEGVSIGHTYELRGRIYKQLGLPDSALVNMEKGYEMQLSQQANQVRDKVIEVESRYQTKYKQQQIDEQQLALHTKNTQLGLLVIIVLLILALAIGLYIGYHKQRQAKHKLIEQNTLSQNQSAQLKSLDAAKSRFFANVSHELRTPLSLIAGPISTLLKDDHQNPRQTTLLKTVGHSVRQLELMVNDILDLRKLEVGKMTVNPEPTSLLSFFEIHLGQFESRASHKQIRYHYDLRIDPALIANLDREKCRQILYNLLSNAFKFTPANGQVRVAIWFRAGQLFIDVADTGPGIHSDDLPQVFTRFFQTSKTGHLSAGGTGIGLSICHDYVHLMQGDITVQSKPGEGSVFRVSWPLTAVESENTPTAPLLVQAIPELYEIAVPVPKTTSDKTAANVSATGPTILVVEDNPGLRAYIGLILGEQYRVVMAENGAEALETIARAGAPIDLVLSDLMMPVMDGYTLLENLKSDHATRHIPVIMLTARAEAADRLHALRIGVDDYLTKPFDEEELLVRIANLLKNQLVRRQEAVLESDAEGASPDLPESDQAWLEKIETYVQHRIASDILTIPALSDAFAMSESTLLRQVKRLTGLTPVQYIQEIRLDKARLLLENDPHILVATVAAEVGYKDARSFSRSFKSRFGKLPSEVTEA